MTFFGHSQASIHQRSFNEEESQGDWDVQDEGEDSQIVDEDTDTLFPLDGGLADELRMQQREEEPMDWDEMDSSLLDEINRLREMKCETDKEQNIIPDSLLSLTHANGTSLG
jgi:hypothetical protein